MTLPHKEIKKKFLAALILGALVPSLGAGVLQDLTEIHRYTWARNNGDCDKGSCCRHAATRVWLAARDRGLNARMIAFNTAPSGGHVIPAVEYNGRWHLFETKDRGGYLANRWNRREIPRSRSHYWMYTGRRPVGDIEIWWEPHPYWFTEVYRWWPKDTVYGSPSSLR